MTIIGTAITIVAFWSIAAFGLFLAFAALSGLRGGTGGLPFIPPIAGTTGWRRRTALAVEAALLLIAAFQVVVGIYGVFSTVY
ncbi:MAG: hypothetical protein GTN93_11230 [Anaerolineae bacterium]|nr:hypothetical protein [Anaerolineae bacterium]